jgi:hypothetical protein
MFRGQVQEEIMSGMETTEKELGTEDGFSEV